MLKTTFHKKENILREKIGKYKITKKKRKHSKKGDKIENKFETSRK